MAGLTAASSISDALKSQAVEGVVQSLFVNNEVMGEFPMRDFTGGSTINVKHHYAGNTSVIAYSEGDAAGVAGSQSYVTAQWPEQHYKCTIQITGHARDYLRNGSNEAAFYDQIQMEFDRGMDDIVDLVSTDMLGTGTTAPVGIQGIVDSAGTVAGLSRVTYSWFQAYETTGTGTTIAIGDLDSAMYNSSDVTYDGKVDEIWVSPKQLFKLKGVIGNPGTTASPYIKAADGTPINLGDARDAIPYGRAIIKSKRDLTNSVVVGLTKPDFFIGRARDWQVDPLAKTDDSDKFLVTGAFGLGNMNPKRSWKITGYTA